MREKKTERGKQRERRGVKQEKLAEGDFKVTDREQTGKDIERW